MRLQRYMELPSKGLRHYIHRSFEICDICRMHDRSFSIPPHHRRSISKGSGPSFSPSSRKYPCCSTPGVASVGAKYVSFFFSIFLWSESNQVSSPKHEPECQCNYYLWSRSLALSGRFCCMYSIQCEFSTHVGFSIIRFVLFKD
jgi:hypothetical protein